MKLRRKLLALGAAAAVVTGVSAYVIPNAMAATTWKTFSYQSAGGRDVFLNVDASRYHIKYLRAKVYDSQGHKIDFDYYLSCNNSSWDSAHWSSSYTVQAPYTRTWWSMPGGYHYNCNLSLSVNDHRFDTYDWINAKVSYVSS